MCSAAQPDTGRTAQRPRVRVLCAAFPSRSPLLPALTRSLRAASAFLTTPPHKAERAWSGTLRLYYTSKQTEEETNPETHWGTRNRPRPQENHGPGSRFPRPLLPPTGNNDGSRRTNDRGKAGWTTVPAAPGYREMCPGRRALRADAYRAALVAVETAALRTARAHAAPCLPAVDTRACRSWRTSAPSTANLPSGPSVGPNSYPTPRHPPS